MYVSVMLRNVAVTSRRNVAITSRRNVASMMRIRTPSYIYNVLLCAEYVTLFLLFKIVKIFLEFLFP